MIFVEANNNDYKLSATINNIINSDVEFSC